ncbi:hypothetical protein [Flavobacterium pectinovorum]|uniref:PH domain-containing protein n=1 Tax=Flavobacterium pectinovorum TaxID=29533 RepID=A0A502EML3_9FLAO|nr:hypothetical protein [Flavobacterium pectinovorum]TPG37511.1 hypothetical protein EAH81_18645 [Flavobacterium pectinovorum]
MKNITRNKILIIVYILIVGSTFFFLIEREKEFWRKAALFGLGVTTVVLYIRNINSIIYYRFIDDVLIIRQMFTKQKHYSLQTVSSWSENQYELLGIETGRNIVLSINGGTKIILSKSNSKDFEKLSDYLNENFPDAFENK